MEDFHDALHLKRSRSLDLDDMPPVDDTEEAVRISEHRGG